MFTMYLAEHLGGGPAVRQLVQDTATGGRGVENLLISPQSGQVGLLGRTMNEVFANFSIAATLDSDQGIYGYPNLQLNPVCSGGAFCRAQATDTNSDWSDLGRPPGTPSKDGASAPSNLHPAALLPHHSPFV